MQAENKKGTIKWCLLNMAEGQGFEPWVGYKPTPVFKTGALNHSATLPLWRELYRSFRYQQYLNEEKISLNTIIFAFLLLNKKPSECSAFY